MISSISMAVKEGREGGIRSAADRAAKTVACSDLSQPAAAGKTISRR